MEIIKMKMINLTINGEYYVYKQSNIRCMGTYDGYHGALWKNSFTNSGWCEQFLYIEHFLQWLKINFENDYTFIDDINVLGGE
jgi:hypothetical protein